MTDDVTASRVPAPRRRLVNRAPLRPSGRFVLYWMTSARRFSSNYALDRAVELARRLQRPLIVLEALRSAYPWWAARTSDFVRDGMRHHARQLAGSRVAYYPYIERAAGEGRGLLRALAHHAAVVVTDDYPAFFLPRMLAAAGAQLPVRVEAVDSNGLVPLASTGRVFPTAHAFRRFLHQVLPDLLSDPPLASPLRGAPLEQAHVPSSVVDRWPMASVEHGREGGGRAARHRLVRWLDEGLSQYADHRNQPFSGAASALSPYLHFGHMGSWEVLRAVLKHEGWHPGRLGPPTGSKQGWWGVRAGAEAFLDELITWRELGFNNAAHDPAWMGLTSLPNWAQRTLSEHGSDRREWTYGSDQLEAAETHDPIWNAVQRQLVGEGRVEGYLRMLWGKKILEWSPDPQTAVDAMVDLNNRYALDGRDPNSWSGILWCLGKFDRPWAPTRPVFGTVRYMSSESTRRKFKLGPFLDRWGR